MSDAVDELAKLAQLRDTGVISQDEFEKLKKRIVEAAPTAAPPPISASVSTEPAASVAPAKRRGLGVWGRIGVLFSGLFLLVIVFAGLSINKGSNTNRESAEEAALSLEQVKAQAREIPYESLARNPDQYTGAIIFLRGKVLQVLEHGDGIDLRIDVTPGSYGLWKDTVFVEYQKRSANEGRILEDDIVKVWGKFTGIISYKAIMNNTVQIPGISARAIENEGKG